MDTAALQSVLNQEFRSPLADLVNRSHPFLSAIRKVAVSGGDGIKLGALVSSNHNARAIPDGSVVTVTAPTSTYAGGKLPWATYISEFRVNARTMAELQGQPGALGQILETEIAMAGKDLARKIAADLWGGTSVNGLVGVADILSATGSYAGIDRATTPEWRGVVYDAAGAEISTGMLDSAEEQYFMANGMGMRELAGNFTAMITPALLTKYSALLEKIDLGSLATAHFVNRANSTGFLGHSVMGWMGIPFIRDPGVNTTGDTADTGRLCFMDLEHIQLAVLDPFNKEAVARKAQIDTYGVASAPQVDGINTDIVVLGTQGEFVAGYVRAYIQVFSDNPRKAGLVIKNVAA